MAQTRDTHTFEKRAVLAGVHFDCTHCLEVKPAAEFGFRTMPNGEVRNQSQCKECRSRYESLRCSQAVGR